MYRNILCGALFIAAMPATAQEGVKRTMLGTIDSSPGYQTVMGIAEIAPNTCAGRHTHPGIETTYILEGELTMKITGQPDKQYKAGGAFQIPAGVVHDGCTTSSGVKGLTVYVIEKGKPLGSPVP
jgi:quercetin dioxygenase-like cupin family protein